MSFVSKKVFECYKCDNFYHSCSLYYSNKYTKWLTSYGIKPIFFSWWILLATTYINIFSWWNCSPWNEYVCFMAIWKSYRKS